MTENNNYTESVAHECIKTLASQCDGAMSSDGVGFSACDVPLGHALASKNTWTDPEMLAACALTRKYKAQLLCRGLDANAPIEFLQKESRANCKSESAKIRKRDVVTGSVSIEKIGVHSFIFFRVGYNERFCADVKRLLGRSWDRTAKAWLAPLCSENFTHAKLLSAIYGLDLKGNEWSCLKPKPLMNVRVKDNKLIIKGAYLPLNKYEPSADPDADADEFYALSYRGDSTYSMFLTTWNICNFLLWIENNGSCNDLILGGVWEKAKNLVSKRYIESLEREKAHLKDSSSKATENKIDVVLPDGKKLMPHQASAIESIVAGKQVLLADEQGLGKTIEALIAIEVADAWPAIIVCPAIARLNWRDEVEQWLPHRTTRVLGVAARDAGSKDKIPDVTILNFEIFGKHEGDLLKLRSKSIVCDEAQYLKTYNSKRTEAVKDFLHSAKMNYRIMMTGTPIMNRPAELMTIMTLLPDGLSALGGFGYFAARYCRAHAVATGFFDQTRNDFTGSGNLDELAFRIRSTCMIRREKKNVLPDLKEKAHEIINIEISNRDEYERADKEFEGWLASKPRKKTKNKKITNSDLDAECSWMEGIGLSGLTANDRGLALKKIGALRQLAGIGKVEASIPLIEDIVKDEKLVVFAYHVDVQQQIINNFPNALKISSDQTPGARNKVVNQFQTDPNFRLIVCSLKAAQTAITLTAARKALFIELDWSPSGLAQAEDRVHRIGQKGEVVITKVVCAGTLDERMLELLKEKDEIANAVTNGAVSSFHKDVPFGYTSEGLPRKQLPGPGRPRLTNQERASRRKASKASWQKANSDYMRDYMRKRRASKRK